MAPGPLTFPPTLIDEAVLRAGVRRLTRFGRIRYLVSVDSTNARALEVLYERDALGISFVTESQDKGRGRAGRRWLSPAAAGVYCTTILPVEVGNRMLPAVGFWAALAAASAISKHTGRQPELKWPNDLLLEDKKCCGILTEGRSFGGTNRLAVGVGINVNRPPGEFQAAWLSDVIGRAIDRTQLTIDLLAEYERRLDSLGDPEGVIREWATVAQLEGKQIAVRAPDGSILHEGTANGIASDGALLLETKSGPVTVRLGDVQAL